MHDTISNYIFKFFKNTIFSEYYVFIQNYLMYNFFYYLNQKKVIHYSFFLHFNHILSLTFKKIIDHREYNSDNHSNILFLKDFNYILFHYFTFLKIIFLKNSIYQTSFLLSCITLFNILNNIHYIYKKRLTSIENNKDFNHFYKFLIITPNKDTIQKIIHHTRYFNYSNYLLFINILFYFFL